jgi:hypothetical protein
VPASGFGQNRQSCHSAASSGCLSGLQRGQRRRACVLSVCRACSQYERGVKCFAGISSPDLTPQSSSMDCQISLLVRRWPPPAWSPAD